MRSGGACLIYDGACAFCRRWVERVHRCDRGGFRIPGGLPVAERLYVWIAHRWGPLGSSVVRGAA